MPLNFEFQFPLPNGLHARPASHLQAEARRFTSGITLHNARSGHDADAKSVLSLIAADVRQGDPCRLSISGSDEAAAIESLKRFVNQQLPSIDESLAEAPTDNATQDIMLPRSLLATGLKTFLSGRGVSVGIGIGRAVRFDAVPAIDCEQDIAQPSAIESARLSCALDETKARIDGMIRSARTAVERGIFSAHLAIAEDPSLRDQILARIQCGSSLRMAVRAAGAFFADQLQAGSSDYLRERAADVEDVCRQILQSLSPSAEQPTAIQLQGPSVVVCNDLTPSQFLQLNRSALRGLVLGSGGTTSHTVILARSMAVPTIVGVPIGAIASDTELIVDAGLGLVISQITPAVRRYYDLEQRRVTALHQRSTLERTLPARTIDGRSIEVGVNVMSADEVTASIEAGADGVGLFRTEMLFMDRPAAPSEQEQFEIYSRAAQAAGGKPVIIRLADIGGDKPAEYLKLPHEENPFLGCRGIRLWATRPDLFLPQIRALLRVAVAGNIKLLVPMITRVEEIREVRQAIEQLHRDLTAQGIAAALPPLGIMLEVPSITFLIEDLAREVDFFSVGSNDLTQYLQAADRGNPQTVSLYDWAHPAVLRALAHICRGARKCDRWIGLCGEMAGDSAATPLLLAMGFSELSVSTPALPTLRKNISSISGDASDALLTRVLACSTTAEVRDQLKAFSSVATTAPLLSNELILLDLAAESREEVVKLLADQLAIVGRTDDPKSLESAIWAREDVYSTGFGYGFAVPHCQSPVLKSSSIVVAKLAKPVAWGGIDGQPVDIVFLLAIRPADHQREHMKILAQLSRLMMRENFREQVRGASDKPSLLARIESQLFGRPAAAVPPAASPLMNEA